MTLLLPSDTHVGLPQDPGTHEPHWRRVVGGKIEAEYTERELGWALVLAGKVEAGVRLLGGSVDEMA